MAIKVFGFPTQLRMFAEEKKSLQRAELTKNELLGKWIGIYEYDSTSNNRTIQLFDSATMIFDTNTVTLIDFRNADSIQLFVDFNSEFWGYIHKRNKDDWKNQYDFWIRNLSADSLEITLMQSLDYYKFKMVKTPPNNGYSK